MKLRNWRTYYGYRRPALISPPKDPTVMRAQYIDWLIANGRVYAADGIREVCAMAIKEIRRRRKGIIAAQADLAAAKNSYRRKKAKISLQEAEDAFVKAEAKLDDREALRRAALHVAAANYIAAQATPYLVIVNGKLFRDNREFHRYQDAADQAVPVSSLSGRNQRSDTAPCSQ